MKNLQKGFSLIELLVVVAIIGILAAIGSVGYSKYIDKAKEGAGSANVQVISNALLAEDTTPADCDKTVTSASTCAGSINGPLMDCSNPEKAKTNVKVVDGTKTATVSNCDGSNSKDITLSRFNPPSP